jgi:hypothetical protein
MSDRWGLAVTQLGKLPVRRWRAPLEAEVRAGRGSFVDEPAQPCGDCPSAPQRRTVRTRSRLPIGLTEEYPVGRSIHPLAAAERALVIDAPQNVARVSAAHRSTTATAETRQRTGG